MSVLHILTLEIYQFINYLSHKNINRKLAYNLRLSLVVPIVAVKPILHQVQRI